MTITTDQLAARIATVLESRESCPIFGQTIKEVWSNAGVAGASQAEVICSFAKEHGFEAQFTDPGVLVAFRNARQPE
jgi:hypothetical protein